MFLGHVNYFDYLLPSFRKVSWKLSNQLVRDLFFDNLCWSREFDPLSCSFQYSYFFGRLQIDFQSHLVEEEAQLIEALAEKYLSRELKVLSLVRSECY